MNLRRIVGIAITWSYAMVILAFFVYLALQGVHHLSKASHELSRSILVTRRRNVFLNRYTMIVMAVSFVITLRAPIRPVEANQ